MWRAGSRGKSGRRSDCGSIPFAFCDEGTLPIFLNCGFISERANLFETSQKIFPAELKYSLYFRLHATLWSELKHPCARENYLDA